MVARSIFRVGLAGLALTAWMAAGAEAGFTIADLGVLGPGGTSVANAINANGWAAGTGYQSDGSTKAAQTRGPGGFVTVPLGSITAGSSVADGINASGNVAGSFYDGANMATHAFRTVGAGNAMTAQDLGTLDGGKHQGTDIQVAGINAGGQVVGTGYQVDGTQVAFRGDATSGFLTAVAPLVAGQAASGNGINDSGVVVGSAVNASGFVRAFVNDPTLGTSDVLKSNNATGFGSNSYGMAINATGSVAGYADFNGDKHAFLAPKGGSVIDLGVIGGEQSSYAYSLNAGGRVVGQLDDNQGGNQEAFIWDPSVGMVDLHSLISAADQANWRRLTLASGINDSTQIVGQGYYNGQLHGFLMTPIPGQPLFSQPSAVPEPPALVLSALGSVIAAGWGRFKLRRGRTGGRAVA